MSVFVFPSCSFPLDWSLIPHSGHLQHRQNLQYRSIVSALVGGHETAFLRRFRRVVTDGGSPTTWLTSVLRSTRPRFASAPSSDAPCSVRTRSASVEQLPGFPAALFCSTIAILCTGLIHAEIGGRAFRRVGLGDAVYVKVAYCTMIKDALEET